MSAVRDYQRIVRNDPCSYCGGPGGTSDHIYPSVTGGADEWGNLTGACLRCNASKGGLTLLGFLCRDHMRRLWVAPGYDAERARLEMDSLHALGGVS